MRRSTKNLKAGDRIYNGSMKGVVYAVDKNKAVLLWDHTDHIDVLEFKSPLWMFINHEPVSRT